MTTESAQYVAPDQNDGDRKDLVRLLAERRERRLVPVARRQQWQARAHGKKNSLPHHYLAALLKGSL